jgi:hypothetical protein
MRSQLHTTIYQQQCKAIQYKVIIMDKNKADFMVKQARKPNMTETYSMLFMACLVSEIEASIDKNQCHLLTKSDRNNLTNKRHSAMNKAIHNLKANYYDTKRYVR